MSLDKAIEHGKEHRKPYKGSKRIDRTCRNHGSCDWCKGNRLHKHKKQEEKMNMGICENCLHEHVCPERSKNAVTICASYKEQNTDNAMCIYDFGAVCNYPIEDCRNCPVRMEDDFGEKIDN